MRRCPHRHEPYGDEFLNLSDPKHVHKRAHARSYDTPLITRAYRSVNAPLGPELAAIRFLERMGYDVHYATGFDLSGKHADNILKRWPVWKSTSVSGALMTRPCWLRRAVLSRHPTPSSRRRVDGVEDDVMIQRIWKF